MSSPHPYASDPYIPETGGDPYTSQSMWAQMSGRFAGDTPLSSAALLAGTALTTPAAGWLCTPSDNMDDRGNAPSKCDFYYVYALSEYMRRAWPVGPGYTQPAS